LLGGAGLVPLDRLEPARSCGYCPVGLPIRVGRLVYHLSLDSQLYISQTFPPVQRLHLRLLAVPLPCHSRRHHPQHACRHHHP
jgi:hypothetical protein